MITILNPIHTIICTCQFCGNKTRVIKDNEKSIFLFAFSYCRFCGSNSLSKTNCLEISGSIPTFEIMAAEIINRKDKF